MKKFKIIISLVTVCVILLSSINVWADDFPAYLDDMPYVIYDLNLESLDTYILLNLYNMEAYKVFTKLELFKMPQVQAVYKDMETNLTGDETREEVGKVFSDSVFPKVLDSINAGAPVDLLLDLAPRTMAAYGVDITKYENYRDKIGLREKFKSRSFESLSQLANEINCEIGSDVAFLDIGTLSEKANEAVIALAGEGVLKGRENKLFCPDEYVTRAEFAKILVLAFGMEMTGAECNFKDVNTDSWYGDYVATVSEKGYVIGNDGNFYPDNGIKMQDAALILYRILGSPEDIDSTAAVGDSNVSDYAAEAVRICKDMFDNSTGFDAQAITTRAQAACAVYNAMAYKKVVNAK